MGFFQPMDSLGSIMVNVQAAMKPYILVELNPIILGTDVERMDSVQSTVYSALCTVYS